MSLPGRISTPTWRALGLRARVAEALQTSLIVLVVALALRTFFVQSARIPTASMQPTLFGLRVEDLRGQPVATVATGLRRFWHRWGRGVSYHQVVPGNEGRLEAGLRVAAGDHLLIDRVSFNFRKPSRGEILVFATSGLRVSTPGFPAIPQDQIYIKRLVGLPREQIRIGDDRHLVVGGVRLDEQTPHFHAIYSFDPSQPPRPNNYVGHLNAATARPYLEPGGPNPAPRFSDATAVFAVRSAHLLVMGDNSLESLDGRAWGDFSERQVIGRVAFVYWPFNKRWLRAIR